MGLDEKSKIDFAQERHVMYLLRTYRQAVLLERFIKDLEFGVSVLGTKPDEVFDVVEVTLNGKPTDKNYLTSKIVYRDDYGLDAADAEGVFLESKLAGEGGILIICLDDPVRYYAGMPP